MATLLQPITNLYNKNSSSFMEHTTHGVLIAFYPITRFFDRLFLAIDQESLLRVERQTRENNKYPHHQKDCPKRADGRRALAERCFGFWGWEERWWPHRMEFLFSAFEGAIAWVVRYCDFVALRAG
jgi:hypothetical protein